MTAVAPSGTDVDALRAIADRVAAEAAPGEQVEAYVSVREESTGAVSNQTHLLQVAKQEGGEWTITGSIGG